MGTGAMPQPPFAKEGFASLLNLLWGVRVDHVGVVGRDLVMQPLGSVGEQVAVLVDGGGLRRRIAPDGGQSRLQARTAVDDQEFRLAQPTLHEVIENRSPGLLRLATHVLTASSTFWPSSRTPSTTRSEIDVAFLSSRTRTTVPSRIKRTIGSSASERLFHTSQSPCTFRHTPLTVSLPTAPPNSAASALRTRRVAVPYS